MRDVIGSILPLAVVVAISPINIVAAILLLFSKRPITNAMAYLGGFLLGVAAVLSVLTVLADAIGLSAGSGRSKGASVLLLVLGALLIVVAIRKFARRPSSDEEPESPKWMQGIADFNASQSIMVGGSVGALNPKNIAVAFAAAVLLATAQLPGGQQVGVIAIYTVIASLGVAAPIVATAGLGDRSQTVLNPWKEWLSRNNATVMSVIYLVFGVILVGKGIAGI